MNLYYAVIDEARIAMTWARSISQARDLLEVALADDGDYNTGELQIECLHCADGPVVVDLQDF